MRADVIARALRRDGDNAAIITGTDAHENWVLADGLTSGRTPEQTCAHFHSGITTDLANLGVEFDTWIDPLDPDHAASYAAVHHELLRRMRATGLARLRQERVPFGTNTGRALVGTWLAGRCPVCSAACGGNTCTGCGAHFQPEEVLNPRSRLTDEPLEWVSRSHWFVRPENPTQVVDGLRDRGLPERFLGPVHDYLGRDGGRIRLSQPGPWGIPTGESAVDSVVSNTYYAYAVYCAQLHARRDGHHDDNTLRKDSDVTVVGLFGTDNSIAGLVAPHVIAAASGLKPFDHTVVNHMLHYEGDKLSTSKRHGIWITDLIENTDITTDELRWALAHLPLDHQIGDITADALCASINHLRGWRRDRLRIALLAADRAVPGSPTLLATAAEVIAAQRHHLTPPTVDLATATTLTRHWLVDSGTDLADPAQATAWLRGVAELTTPIMPLLARQILTALDPPCCATTEGSGQSRLSSVDLEPVRELDPMLVRAVAP
ncbi:class I tRNA ligase family protein [Umezawaea sp. Da 62-37]|uniref:class I tRNA ligase family protein n=1 Tax=Umezawaea sp. Da 62-37 TaxID=3075927 RepID=UPI0028F72CAB|nr:class I tRNA ligase family protein [Umezawaea sp. Da 62-37]WNV92016.1 class I tRNA ligase family protein [Umezawaea sp. Da 62-37]